MTTTPTRWRNRSITEPWLKWPNAKPGTIDCLEAETPVSFDVEPGNDALEVARTLGDPVLEFIVGNRVPSSEVLP